MQLDLDDRIALVTGASKGIAGHYQTCQGGLSCLPPPPPMMQLATGRLADPKEIAFAVAFLASPRSASTTGAEFVVDSGMLKTS